MQWLEITNDSIFRKIKMRASKVYNLFWSLTSNECKKIWAYSILLITFLSNFDEIYIQVFKRLVATSRAPQIMVLSMLRSFGKIGPQIDQIWAWLSRGHRWSPGVRNPLKSSVKGLSLLVNCFLEIKFLKIIRVNLPPPLKPKNQPAVHFYTFNDCLTFCYCVI